MYVGAMRDVKNDVISPVQDRFICSHLVKSETRERPIIFSVKYLVKKSRFSNHRSMLTHARLGGKYT